MPTFMSTLASNPALLQAVSVALKAAAGNLTDANTQLTTASVTNLDAVWTGDVREAQKKHVDDVARSALAVVAAMVQAAQTTSTGATQMQAQQAQLAAIVQAALSGRYAVLPTGQVTPGPAHYAQAASSPHGSALIAMYRYFAGLFTADVNATVAQTTATDAQVAAILAALAAEFFAQLLQKSANSASGTGGAALAASNPPDGASGFHAYSGTGTGAGLSGTASGTSLAGAGSGGFGGATLSGGPGLGAGAATAAAAGTMGGVGLASVGPGQVAAGATAGVGRAASAGGPAGAMVGGRGTGHAAGDEEWRGDLVDDSDAFATDELPGPVVT